ncbi:MAG: F0F1 ATP synthase subunit A, partial [Campylobacteraceae bacterium]|nr:F0F1 ATP synthase subunit A [Campylobacteraceae bacterium]
ISDQLGAKQGEQYFPYIFALFTFLLVVNLLGMIPYSFTVMSHIIIIHIILPGYDDYVIYYIRILASRLYIVFVIILNKV